MGESSNYQVGGTFVVLEPIWITAVTADFLTANGSAPEKLCVRFYRGCPPLEIEEITLDSYPTDFLWQAFDDPVYGLPGRRAIVLLDSIPRLDARCWVLSIQPATEGEAYLQTGATYGTAYSFGCAAGGHTFIRDGRDYNPCCVAGSERGYWSREWEDTTEGTFEPDALSMRIEGIPAGDCVGGERVRARCKLRDGEHVGDVVVKVRSGQPNGVVTALLDPPDPKSMSISLDDSGRGKGKFRRVPIGDHRVFVCDAIVDVTCAP
ncbi:MAG: hypothetical protein IT449_10355 [Phycisphaerales bacterium]|nr:hypothetical protein [Phycisphaerales bacterium]